MISPPQSPLTAEAEFLRGVNPLYFEAAAAASAAAAAAAAGSSPAQRVRSAQLRVAGYPGGTTLNYSLANLRGS